MHPTAPGAPLGAAPTGPTATAYPAPRTWSAATGPTGPAPAGPTPPFPPAGPVWSASGPVPPVGPLTSLPKEPVQRAGAGSLGVVVALTLLTLAALLYADRVDAFDGPVVLTTGAVAIILLGIAVAVAGLRGRTAGGPASLAIILLIAFLPLAAIDRADWRDADWGGGAPFGEVDRTPTTVAEAEEGWAVGAGEMRIDLTQVPLGGETVEVPVRVGAGDVTLVIPEGAAVEAEVDVMAGELRWLDETSSGTTVDETYRTDAVTDGAEPEIRIDLRVGAGSVRVVEG